MDIRPLTPDHSVAPQIELADIPEIAAAGYRTVICNRPDDEVLADLGSDAMAQAVQAAGMTFVYNPMAPGSLTEEMISAQLAAMEDAGGPSLAYCRSGTRSSNLWALAKAPDHTADELITAAAAQGYDLSGLRPLLTSRAG